MAPFIGRPEGFSDESLELLDKAMTEMWMRQVAIGAAMSGTTKAPPQPALRDPHLNRLIALDLTR
jgi:hypothetical protein